MLQVVHRISPQSYSWPICTTPPPLSKMEARSFTLVPPSHTFASETYKKSGSLMEWNTTASFWEGFGYLEQPAIDWWSDDKIDVQPATLAPKDDQSPSTLSFPTNRTWANLSRSAWIYNLDNTRWVKRRISNFMTLDSMSFQRQMCV